ncbi:alpha/beta hydrolase [Amycolatopsis sp. NPDC049253]|uniref:alpha/beta hydrolase n=1 Tax=Amycolatopsis sp. NPDC049253 TaxID=3155274 RepID=UPI00343B38EC
MTEVRLEGGASLTPYPAGAPAIVVLPGGAYGKVADHEGTPVARWLNSLGVSAFVLRYRVAPHRYPAPLLDAARAVRHVRHHAASWPVDPARVGVLGFSAGGHLAGLLATETGPMLAGDVRDAVDEQDPRPDLAVLCYPVTTFISDRAHQGSIDNLLGPAADESLRRKLSLHLRASPATPPTFLWHTADDELVPVANSLLLADALTAHSVPTELHVYPRGEHGLGLAETDPIVGGWTDACAAFLRGQGWS